MFERPPTAREELANTLSHGVGFLLTVFAALPLLVLAALPHHDPLLLAGAAIFGLSLALLYAASTLYHLLPPGRSKVFCRLLDHAAIYVLIAGTYTPFALGVLRGPLGWTIFAAAWLLAAVGFGLKLRFGFRYPLVSTALYLLMGWMSLLILRPLVAGIGWEGFGWLLAGGLCYTLGVAFYLWERLHYSHLYWHGFVLAGSACHLVAILHSYRNVGA